MKKILIVDDKPCVRSLLSEELSEWGYQTEGSDNVESTLDSMEKTVPALVILDLRLKDKDGFYLFQEIKARYPLVPVIIFTAYDGYRNDSRLAGADGYVIKSLNFQKLNYAIEKAICTAPTPSFSVRSVVANQQTISA